MQEKINSIIFCFGIVLAFFLAPSFTYAEMNVKDCLESEDCFESEAVPAEQLNEEQLLDNEEFEQPSFALNIIKTIVALLLVLALIYLLLMFLKRRNQMYQQSSVLQNLGGVSVGQNKSVQLVRVGDKVFLIGVGENVEMLEEVTDESLKEQLLHTNAENSEQFPLLQQLFQKKKKKGIISSARDNQSFTDAFNEELTKLKENRKQYVDRYLHDKKDDDTYV